MLIRKLLLVLIIVQVTLAKINKNFKQLALTDIDNLKDKLKEFETPKKSSLKAFVELEKLVKNIVFDQAIGI